MEKDNSNITGSDPVQDKGEDFVRQSRQKLETVAESLQPWVVTCRQLSCQTEEDTRGYRCRCSFQLIVDDHQKLHYAIRQDQRPTLIDSFPIASRRIQNAMKGLLEALNSERFESFRQSLTSVSFSSSWSEHASCLLTLHYNAAFDDETNWAIEARYLCAELELTQCTGRSRKRVVRAIDDSDNNIKDTVWIEQGGQGWTVGLDETHFSSQAIAVHYSKPEGAFFHPNARAMCSALRWTLQRLTLIREDLGRMCRLLEMYCGCGAHTVALARSGLVERMVAVELDERLVEACQVNCRLNGIESGTVEIVSQDAGKWARKPPLEDFDILLVDPPRQGLDEQVCRMAINGSIQHFLYISCGRDALVRDLNRLTEAFEVVDCTLLDLFPRTNAVESLVHLRRLRV